MSKKKDNAPELRARAFRSGWHEAVETALELLSTSKDLASARKKVAALKKRFVEAK